MLVEVLRYRSSHYQYEVLCLAAGGPLVAEIEKIGVPVTILGKRRGIDPKHAWELYRWLRRARPQIVHTHLFTADAWGRSCAWLARIPGIFSTAHSTNAWKSSVHLLIDKALAGISDRVIACSSEVQKLLLTQGLPEHKLISIANGVDLQRINDAPETDLLAEFGIGSDTLRFALVGRLHPAKGHEDLLPVLAKLKETGLDFSVLFIGEGELEVTLKATVKQMKLEDRVYFTGFRSDVISLLKSVDWLLMPSRWEGLPMTLLESMACGTPALASQVGGIPEVIKHGSNGYLYPAGDADALFRQMQQLLQQQSVSPEMQAAACNTIGKKYSAASVTRAYETLYEQVNV